MTSSTAVSDGGPGPVAGAGDAEGEPKSTPLAAGDAFGLGWQMAELRNYAPNPAADRGSGELPGLSRLKKRCANTAVLLSQLNAGIARVRGAVPDDTRPALETGRGEVVEAFAAVCAKSAGDAEDQRFRDSVEALHEAVVAGLLGADYKLAKAYSLGVKLAWITQAPAQGWNRPAASESRPTTLGQGKLAQARKHLTDLGTVLPEHSSRAVQLSAGAWAEWDRVQAERETSETSAQAVPRSSDTSSQVERQSSDQPAEPERTPGDPATGSERVLTPRATEELARQGEIWRSLLSGEKDGTDMLATRDYERAAQLMFEQTKQIGRRFVADHAVAVLALALIVVLAIGGLIVASATSQVIAALGVLLASAGVTWKAATATLGDVAQRLGTPMWGAQLDRAIAEAITTLPDPGVQQLALTWASTEIQAQGRRTRGHKVDPGVAWWQHIADGQRPSGPAPKARRNVRAAQREPGRRLTGSLGRLRHRRDGRRQPKTTSGRRS